MAELLAVAQNITAKKFPVLETMVELLAVVPNFTDKDIFVL